MPKLLPPVTSVKVTSLTTSVWSTPQLPRPRRISLVISSETAYRGRASGGIDMTYVTARTRRNVITVAAAALILVAASAAAAPAGADLGAPTGTGAQSGSHSVAVPPTPVLSALTAGAHVDFDRVVLTFDGALPSWRVEYGSVQNGQSGQPLTLAGSATLRVDLRLAQAHNASGTATVPRDQRPGLATVRELAVAEDFEGVVIVGVGLSGRVGLRVFELTAPKRLVIDVAHVRAAPPASPVSAPARFTG
ncbi:MAG: hypothetical protein NVSMB13_08210 [Mycobacteriales bacterium]